MQCKLIYSKLTTSTLTLTHSLTHSLSHTITQSLTHTPVQALLPVPVFVVSAVTGAGLDALEEHLKAVSRVE